MRLSLLDVLAVEQAPQNGTAWHHLILKGFPAASLTAVAENLFMPVEDLAQVLGWSKDELAAYHRGELLSRTSSDSLYRIARALVNAFICFDTPEKTAAWIKQPQAVLKDNIPLVFLLSQIGTEYVNVAIERLKPVDRIEVHQEAPNYEDGLALEAGRNPHQQPAGYDDVDDSETELEVELRNVQLDPNDDGPGTIGGLHDPED